MCFVCRVAAVTPSMRMMRAQCVCDGPVALGHDRRKPRASNTRPPCGCGRQCRAARCHPPSMMCGSIVRHAVSHMGAGDEIGGLGITMMHGNGEVRTAGGRRPAPNTYAPLVVFRQEAL